MTKKKATRKKTPRKKATKKRVTKRVLKKKVSGKEAPRRKAGGAGDELKALGVSVRVVRAGDLKPNTKNWRLHPEGQRAALSASMAAHGWAGVVVVNARTMTIVDGHARWEQVMDQEGPDGKVLCLMKAMEAEEEAALLLKIDGITAMAELDEVRLRALVEEVDLSGELAALGEHFDRELEILSAAVEVHEPGGKKSTGSEPAAEKVPSSWAVIAWVENEAEQEAVGELLEEHGYRWTVQTGGAAE
ncbi:MAG: hypothetical protein AAF593_00240 [Planctomycetota bacterium]